MTTPVHDKKVGLIFNIQRFSIQDGPGIRTTVFMKGCPLRCQWCSNPESWNPYVELMVNDAKCMGCGKCVAACPTNAITMDDTAGRKIDRDLCNLCMQCVDVCPTGSLVCAGQSMTVEDVMQEVLRDLPFYNNSGGGVTVSGGEPLMQWEFVRELLKECKQMGLHTALDTTGEAPWQVLEQVLDYADLVLYDIKHLDPEKHREGTSIDNQLILENARKVAQKARMWLRFPLIPGYNDSSEHVNRIGEFAAQLKVEKVSILPYHAYGEPKYRKLGREYPMSGVGSPDDSVVQEVVKLLETYVGRVTIGN